MAPITDDLVQFPKIFISSPSKNKKYKDLMTFSLPICQRGLFLQDSFFEYVYGAFDEAVRRILERWGERDFVDELMSDTKLRLSSNLSRYRQLRPHNLKEEDQAAVLTADTDTNKIVMDVYGLVDKEVKVKVVGERQVMVEGRWKTNCAHFPLSSDTFRRWFCLPQDTNMDTLSSVMSSDGVLTISAPRTVNQKLSGQQTTIPIRMNDVPDTHAASRTFTSPFTPIMPTFPPLVSTLPSMSSCRVCGRSVGGWKPNDTLESFITSKLQERENDKLFSMKHEQPVFSIPKMGAFFSDSFFRDSWEAFQEAVREVLLRWGDLTSTTDPLTRYRTLRTTDLREDNQAVKSSEDEHNYKFVMDVQDFMDEGEISVKFMNPRELVVEGHVKHNATNSKAEKKFVRRFVLAGEVDVDGASSVMSNDGVLTVVAPKKTTLPLVRELVLPVTMEAGTPPASDALTRPDTTTFFHSPLTRPEVPVTSPTIHLESEIPHVTSPTPSVLSDDSCDSAGRLWTFCPHNTHGVVIEEL